ncbi:MAG TPA: hypothetical protein VHB21_12845, partial [Minicystis sp.]|nr:hypothetical protein [Minicystis sp.]
TLLGFTRPQLRDALVLLDAIDRQLVDLVGPALAGDGKLVLFDAADTSVTRQVADAVEARAGALVREELGALPEQDGRATSELGAALGRRRALFEGWEKALAPRGITLATPTSLDIQGDWRRELRPLVPPRELAELERLEGTLTTPSSAAVFAAVRREIAASIARHEVQHRLDYARPEPLRMPHALEELTGPVEQRGVERRPVARARAEMSAYLAQLARDERTTRVDLTLVFRFLFDDSLAGTPESYAAVAIAEALSEELGAALDGPLVDRGRIVRDRAARIWRRLVDAPQGAIRAGARRAWERAFGEPLPPLRKRSP